MNDQSKHEQEKAGAQAGAGAKEAEEMTEEELREQIERHFCEQKVSDVLIQFLVSMSTLAYAKMGLTEETREHKNPDEARLGIDAYKALLDAVGDNLGEQNSRALAGALASMQMTFVQAFESSETCEETKGEESKGGEKKDSRLWVPGKE